MVDASAFTMSTESLSELLGQIPALAGEPRKVEDLEGGLTNRNVKVTTPDGAFVARISGPDSEDLDIDRDAEHQNTVAAAKAGVGAPVIDYRPDLGVMVIGWIEGVTLHNEDFARAGVVPRAAKAIRQLHDGPRFVGDFNMFERQQGYRDRCREQGYRVPDRYDELAGSFARIGAALAVRDEGTVPCNNDLLAGNFVDDGTKVWLIDYDYSGNNDACFELGNSWTECGLSLDQLEELVTVYYGRPLRNKIARARLQAIVSQYSWALWGCIQSARSPLEFDFWSWGTERYEKAVAEMRSPGFARLLDDATLES